MHTMSRFAFAVALVGAIAPAAYADDPPAGDASDGEAPASPVAVTNPAPATAAASTSPTGNQLVLPRGRWLIDATLSLNLSDSAAFKPVSLSPDVWYGATDKLTIGLVHSTAGATGFQGGIGTSLCLTGSSNGCASFYNDVGVDARYRMGAGDFTWALDGGLYIDAIDPSFQFAVKLGVDGRYQAGKLAIEFAPSLFIGLTNRNPPPIMVGTVTEPAPPNSERLGIPITAIYQATDKVAVAAQLGVILPFSNSGDLFTIPFSIGAMYRYDEHINLGLTFSLPAIAGGTDVPTGASERVLALGGGYAF